MLPVMSMRSMNTRSAGRISKVMFDDVVRGVLVEPRPHLDEGVALLPGLVDHALDDAVDLPDVVDAAAGTGASSGSKLRRRSGRGSAERHADVGRSGTARPPRR